MNMVAYVVAAAAEIGGCFAFWAWLRLGKSVWWLVPGMLSLAVFAYALTFVDSAASGRTYAAYGGVYVAAAVAWLWLSEGVPPNVYDIVGAGVCILGTAIILLGQRAV